MQLTRGNESFTGALGRWDMRIQAVSGAFGEVAVPLKYDGWPRDLPKRDCLRTKVAIHCS